MGALIWHVCAIAALTLSLSNAAPVSDSFVVSARSPVSVPLGHMTTLPCWLNPPQSAESLDVRWSRKNDFESPVLLYRAKQFEDASQDESYKGRVSFGLKDAASGGLKAGDVSLKLVNVTLRDAGDYLCHVSSEKHYDSASVSLIVTKIGSSPLLTAEWKEDNMVNVSCESQGWYPEPSLQWSDPKQALSAKNTKYSNDSSGLLSVRSWILVSSSLEVSCSISLSGGERKESRVRLGKPPEAGSGSSNAGWVLFGLLLTAAVVALGVFYYRKKGKRPTSGSDAVDGPESQRLLQKVTLPTDCYVNVSLDQVENPYLTTRGAMLRDSGKCGFQVQPHFTCHTAIKGMPGFSSGKHYWEVSLESAGVGTKRSWWVGVTSVTEISYDVSPTPSNGFWFLSSSPATAGSFQFNSQPHVLLPFQTLPRTVGVYLNYDDKELSFYDVENETLMGTLKGDFTGEVFPLFNPGLGDKATMKIIQREEDGEKSGIENSSPLPNDTSQQ
ncbi:butyrophilin subfamily 2 member A2-like [Halichoeres trimaculatus]|uniref:butyrophilin subfamily 2 member A2-like n=1 Tax=Halichoeres trimaculatus TaxID=147232 RepID=UPI003D9E5057